MRLRAFKARLASGDEAGKRDLTVAMDAVRSALRRQAAALELHREKRLLHLKMERLEARLAEIEEVRRDPARKLSYLKGPTDPQLVLADMRSVRARLAHIDEAGPL